MTKSKSQRCSGWLINPVKKFFSKRAVQIGSLLAAITVTVYLKNQPKVEDVAVSVPLRWITIRGSRFGPGGWGSYVWLRIGDLSLKLRRRLDWTDRMIHIELPEGFDSGSAQIVKRLGPIRWTSDPISFSLNPAEYPTKPYGYQVPVEPGSPWPTFRRDRRNSACTTIHARYHGDEPWFFQTGKGIFSTPVLSTDGRVFFGSADNFFYVLNTHGELVWRFETGEIIDSAAALIQYEVASKGIAVVVPSGDGFLYCLDTENGDLLWKFDASIYPRSSYNDWFEGNVAIGYDGTIYAGNTNFNYYALYPDGQLKWVYRTGANNWSQAALADDGTLFLGSNDTKIRAIRPDGNEKWTRRTLGFISASAAVGSDGTVYIGSFDSYLYALDPERGRIKWKFKTGDHIYASPALGADSAGNTIALYFGSTDGVLYALDTKGALLWRYDTGAPIRSSAVIGRAPKGEKGTIVYFGCGNGRLYALNSEDGSRRWHFDTTPSDPELVDRNDLNGSPALGSTGIYIGGEHGQLWYVPYDYPLHVSDSRCSTDPGEDLSADLTGLFYVTPGGGLIVDEMPNLPPTTTISLRLVVREGGNTLNARLCRAPFGCSDQDLSISTEPEFPIRWELSADGRFLHLIPIGFLDSNVEYRIHISGNYYTEGFHLGNLTLGGRKTGRFDTDFTFKTNPSTSVFPLQISDRKSTVLEWTRLSVPIPPMLTSLNQIGFDYLDWLMGPIMIGKPNDQGIGRCILWAIGGKRDPRGRLIPDPDSNFILPLSGYYRGDSFILENRNFEMSITGIPIPFNLFQIRGQLDADLQVGSEASAFAETKVLGIPTFGPLLVLAGLANNGWRKLLAFGTYLTRRCPGRYASTRPKGISLTSFEYQIPTRNQAGWVIAKFTLEPDVSYPLTEHRPAIIMFDPERIEALSLNYNQNLEVEPDPRGNLSIVKLTIPKGTNLPPSLTAVVTIDVFPLEMIPLQSKLS